MSTTVQYGRFCACVRCVMGQFRDRVIHVEAHEFGSVRDVSEIRFLHRALSIPMYAPWDIAPRSCGGGRGDANCFDIRADG